MRVGLDCTAGDRHVRGSHVLLAVGRVPNTSDLGLESTGVGVDARGYVMVDDTLATTAPGIWALGDCNGRGAFTHTAYNDFEIVAANLLDGAGRRVSDCIPAYALYTDPPRGRVGLSLAQAQATNRLVLVGQQSMTRVGQAIEKDETQGFMQIVADAETDEILGGTILGIGGDEAIHSTIAGGDETRAASVRAGMSLDCGNLHPFESSTLQLTSAGGSIRATCSV